MCELCDQDPAVREAARARAADFAADLAQLADAYRGMACGKINPHSNAATLLGVKVRNVIRELVAEWI
jgi:hypothetical protein